MASKKERLEVIERLLNIERTEIILDGNYLSKLDKPKVNYCDLVESSMEHAEDIAELEEELKNQIKLLMDYLGVEIKKTESKSTVKIVKKKSKKKGE